MTQRGDHYDVTDDAGILGAAFKVVSWGTDSLVLTGVTLKPDSSGNIAKGVFTAKISADGESAEGADSWEAGTYKGTFPIQLVWGDHALRTPMCSVSSEDNSIAAKSNDASYRLARQAFNAKNYGLSLCWSNMGAKRGDPRSLSMLGIIYSKQEYPGFNKEKSFDYLKQGAEKGDPTGEYLLSLAYSGGMGTQPDPDNATFWMTKAMATPEGRAIDAQAKQQAQIGGPQVSGGGLLMMLLLGAFLGGSDGGGSATSQSTCDYYMIGTDAARKAQAPKDCYSRH